MIDEKIKLAFQDGLRTAIRVLQEHKRALFDDDVLLRGYKQLDEAQRAVRELIDRDLSVPEISYDARLKCVAETIEAILDHARDGGSFRYLIYQRLGFDVDAYVPLYDAGGMDVSNSFVITEADEGDQELASRLLQSFWPKDGSTSVNVIGGQEPWLTVCEAASRIKALSRALQAESEIRNRTSQEFLTRPRAENVGPDGYHAPAGEVG